MSSFELIELDSVRTLLSRIGAELSAEFDVSRGMRLSRAPGRLDVMGGIADYTGSLVCEMTLDRAAAVAIQERPDRQLRIFSFNLYDEHRPFTFGISLDALADHSIQVLRREFNEPGRQWAGYLAGCLFVLHERRLVDLSDPAMKGMNVALHSSVPLGAGVSSSAAIEVAMMMNLRDHFGLKKRMDPMALAALCQRVENQIVGAPCGIMDQASICAGRAGRLFRMLCQPHQLGTPLAIPEGIQLVGIDSAVRHSVGGQQYVRTRCAAFMAHGIIREKMREMGAAAGKVLRRDPMGGYLANLDVEDYKRFFRPFLPAAIRGNDYLRQYGPTIDDATTVNPDEDYPVLQAADHHVLEAMRVRNFIEHMQEAARHPFGTAEQGLALDKAGHLMYASHHSYTHDALLGADECDLLVRLARAREKAGLYGAKITGGGGGGTVAILANKSPRADAALADILIEYERQTTRQPSLFCGSSPGAWEAGTAVVHDFKG